MKNLTLTLILAATMAACGPRGPREIPVLDVTKSYPAKDLVLQDIAEVEYIPLETREGFLIDYFRVHYMDDDIVVTANQKGDIMTFDRKTGEGVNSFNRQGRGPGEYNSIHGIAVDKKAGEMFVVPSSIGSNVYPMYVYDLAGKPLRTLEFDSKKVVFPKYFHNYDGGYLFFLNEDTSMPELYGLMSKSDATVTYLPISFEGRDVMTITQTIGGGTSRRSAGSPFGKTSDGFMISESGLDTMYLWSISTSALTPIMAQTPSWHSMEYPVGMFYMGESSDWMFVSTVERRYDPDAGRTFKTVNLMYDKRDGTFYEGKVVNADFADERIVNIFSSTAIPAGQFTAVIQPYELLDLHEQGKLKGKLAEIVPTLKEDDNPVMMVVTFK
jgi:predicted small lipoprotein YifL